MKKLWILVLALLTACSEVPPATGPLFTTPPAPAADKALIIVYRVPAFGAKAVETQVYTDGHSIAAIHNASYTWFYAMPGSHTVTAVLPECEVVPLVVDIRAGQTYYIRADFEFNITQHSRCIAADVGSAQALNELSAVHSLGHGNDIEK